MKPELSIVIPVYNHPDELCAMIDSIIANSYQPWELLLIDDGSDKQTIVREQEYAKKDPRIKLVERNQLPKGAQTCRNMGLQLAQGEFLIWFDSDDIISDECLKNRVASIKSHPELDFMVFPSGVVENDKIVSGPHIRNMGFRILPDDLSLFAQRFLPFTVWTNIYRVDSLHKFGMNWDVNLLSLQDSDFNIQALLRGMKFDYAQVPIDYYYRINYSSNTIASNIVSKKHQKSHAYWIEKTFQQIQSKYNHRYDYYIYLGALKLFHYSCEKKYDDGFSRMISKIIMNYSKKWGIICNVQFFVIKLFSCLMPYVLSLKFAFFNYYKNQKSMIKKKRILMASAY